MGGFLQKQTKFILKDFFKIHVWKNFFIKSLPGVFGYKKIDSGSKLLASTFSDNIFGKVLDFGSGTGFLSVSLLYHSPNARLTLIDNSIVAVKCSEYTLNLNRLQGEVIHSDLYSNVSKKFDLIISNPPFHNDLKINFCIIREFICNSKQYLKKTGELRFVTSIFFNFDFLLKKTFQRYCVLTKTKKYKVYQAFLN